MDYDYWATVDDVADDRSADATSPLNFDDQDEDFISTHYLLREMMPSQNREGETEEHYQKIRQTHQGRSIKM